MPFTAKAFVIRRFIISVQAYCKHFKNCLNKVMIHFTAPAAILLPSNLRYCTRAESLSKEIMSLKSAINQPEKTRSSEKEFSNQLSQNAQSISATSISPVKTKCQLQLRR